jgi:ribosomal protein S18 acetylase RimI-like enzyme
MRRVNSEVRQPDGCSDGEIAAFCCFVRQGGEVESLRLEGRVRQARALCFLYVGGTLVGVAALKQPDPGYRSKVFKKAAVPKDATLFDLELGWVYVQPDHQSKGYSLVLSAAAKSQSDGAPIFATTRSDNTAMQKTLERLKFKRIGDPYLSEDGERTLLLYVTSSSKPVLTRRNSIREFAWKLGKLAFSVVG